MVIQVLTIDEFLRLPELADKRANRLNQMLSRLSDCVVSEDEKQAIHEEITQLSALLLLMLDHNIKIPKLKKHKVYNYNYEHPLVIRTYYEIFDLLISEDLPTLYKELDI